MPSSRSESSTEAHTGRRAPDPGKRQALGIALSLILVLIAFQCARLGVAGLIVELAYIEQDRWRASAHAQPMDEISRVAGYFSDSLGYVPANPWALEGLGALDLARMRVSKVPAEAHAFAEDARARFREALRQRPSSPFLWANLALSKLYLDQLDDEFAAALRHADEQGPWEPATQRVVLFAGLAAWQKLAPGMRQSVARVVERGAMRDGQKLFEIVKSYRRFDLVCALSSYDAVAGAECRKAARAAIFPEPTRKGNR